MNPGAGFSKLFAVKFDEIVTARAGEAAQKYNLKAKELNKKQLRKLDRPQEPENVKNYRQSPLAQKQKQRKQFSENTYSTYNKSKVNHPRHLSRHSTLSHIQRFQPPSTGRHFYLWEMTQQLGKSSKSIRFAYLHFLQHRLLPTRSLQLCPQRQSACKKQGHRSGELLAILPVAGKFFGLSKRQEALQKEEESRKKAEGKRQETQMQIFSLSISPPPHPRLNRSLSASSHLLRTDRGFLIREEIGAASSKQKKPTLKNCIGE